MLLRTIVVTEFMTNCYILGDKVSHQCFVIDPGGEADKILEALEKDGMDVKAILVTHGHVDHIGAVADIKRATGAPVMIHRSELPLYQAASRMARMFGIRVLQPDDPDRFISEGDGISLDGSITLRVVETPGHSPGGVSFVEEGASICFAGDTLFAGSIGRTDLPGGNYHTLISSIKNRLLPLGDGVRVLPGHGPATTLGAERRYNPFLAGG